MRRVALFVAVPAVATALAVAPPASAARICNLVTDKSGDQAVVLQGTAAAAGSDVDIRSADVAVDRKYVVAAIRLSSLQRFDPRYPAPRQYTLRFTLDSGPFALNAYLGATDAMAWTAGGPSRVMPATLSLDYARAEIRISAPTAQFGKPPITQQELRGIAVEARHSYAPPPRAIAVGPVTTNGQFSGFGIALDTAGTDRTYRAGTPTCVVMPG